MNDNQKTANKDGRELIIGIAILLTVTAVARVLNVINAELADFSTVMTDIFDIIIFILDNIIFAAGAAMILHFIRIENKSYIKRAFLFVLFILALDYSASFLIDFINDRITSGLEVFNFIFLLLNFAARALTYMLLVFLAPAITRNAVARDTHIPVFSRKHPVSRMITAATLLHMAPYIIFEIYSNITGIIEYGWDMTGADILSILSAYVEILLFDGIVAYFAIYVIMVLLSLGRKKNVN